MKTYVGTKIIQASPESKGPLPHGEEGYAVIYEDGYRSWSPKAVFEAAYIEIGDVSGLPPHQQRVVAERAQLDDKREKLHAFMNGNSFFAVCDESERMRMHAQANAMARYSEALESRIAAFTQVGATV